MWKKRGYDNFKDAIEDAKEMNEKAKKFGVSHAAAAKKHLDEVIQKVKKEAQQNSEIAEYLKEII